jgi:fused signal recognition particle receptor
LLLEADFGVPTTLKLVAHVEQLAKRGKVKTEDEFQEALREGVEEALRAGNSDPRLMLAAAKPTVILVTGVNGAGKTTSIAKLCQHLRSQNKKVLLGACDTFRAGAVRQLEVWADRLGVEVVKGQQGGDPAAVAFDAVNAGISRGVDVIILDTAGRLQTQDPLMRQLTR